MELVLFFLTELTLFDNYRPAPTAICANLRRIRDQAK